MANLKLSQITALATTPALTDKLVGVISGTTDNLVSISQIGAALLLQPSGGNLNFFVATTGSDTLNTGLTVGSPFLTIQHAVNVAAGFNYQGQFAPQINVANGTYNNVNVTLPQMYNVSPIVTPSIVGNTSTASSVVLNDSGGTYTFNCGAATNWAITGVTLSGTYGGFFVSAGAAFTVTGTIGVSGTLPHGVFINSGLLNCFGATVVITSTTVGSLLFSGWITNWDNSVITFSNAVTFTGAVVVLDGSYGFLGFDGVTFTNPTNVTMAASTPCLIMTNGAFFENNTGLARTNFPGSSTGPVSIDRWSRFQPDNGYIVDDGGLFGFTNGASGGAVDTVFWRAGIGTTVLSSGFGATGGGTFGAASILGTNATGGIGYANLGLGVGANFNQATSKTTTVAMSTPVGTITMSGTGAIAAGAKVTFTVTNANIATVDVPHVCVSSGGTASAYRASVTAVGAGSCAITIENITAGSLTEAPVISFALIKGATT